MTASSDAYYLATDPLLLSFAGDCCCAYRHKAGPGRMSISYLQTSPVVLSEVLSSEAAPI